MRSGKIWGFVGAHIEVVAPKHVYRDSILSLMDHASQSTCAQTSYLPLASVFSTTKHDFGLLIGTK